MKPRDKYHIFSIASILLHFCIIILIIYNGDLIDETSFKKTDTEKHIAGIGRTKEETPVRRKEEKIDKIVVVGTLR